MSENRCDHVALVIDDTLYCVGGEELKCTEYFSYKTRSWQKGPDLPFTLSNAKGVVDFSSKRLILIGGYRDDLRFPKLGYFDPQKQFVEINGELDCGLIDHFASLM